MKMLGSFGFFFIFVSLLIVSTDCSESVSLDEGRMIVSWSYDEAADQLSVRVNATTIGWVGFGFALAAPNNMQDYDIVLAGYKDGAGYIYDMYSIGQLPPPLDSSQDYSLVRATEEEGRTILHMQRAGNTGDKKDIQFNDSTQAFIVWALHSWSDAIDGSTYPFHERSGTSQAKYFFGRVSSTQQKETSLKQTFPLPALVRPTSSSVIISPSHAIATHDRADREVLMALKASDELTTISASPSTTSVDNVIKSTSLSSLSSASTVMNTPQILPDSKSNSTQEKDLDYNSYENTGFSAVKPDPSPSSDSESKLSTTLQPSATSSFPLDNSKQDSWSSQRAGKDKKNCACYNVILMGAVLICTCLFLTGNVFRSSIMQYWKVRMERNKVRRGMAGLPQNNPSKSEGLIRQLYYQISALDEVKVRKQLHDELTAKASQGLQGDLNEMLDRKGLQLDGLNLVLNNLTSVSRLAKFLYENRRKPEIVENAGLKNVSSILRSDLEVLGALTAEEIDVSKEWVKKICHRAPSLLALSRLRWDVLKDCCQGAEIAEMKVVYRLIGTTQSLHQKKLRQAEKSNTHVEAAESCKSKLEIIARASSGNVLCGIYKSDYQLPQSAGLPLLQSPTAVAFNNPHDAQRKRFMTFSAAGSASKFVQKVKSTSIDIASTASGLYGLLSADFKGGYGQQTEINQFVQTSSTGASALLHIRVAKKTFQLEEDTIQLSLQATKRAVLIMEKESEEGKEESARDFLNRYGSHYPIGVQILGGEIFSIADVQSEESTTIEALTKEAVKYLESKISLRIPGNGIGVSVEGGYIGTTAKQDRRVVGNTTITCNHSVEIIGPQLPSHLPPSNFSSLLSDCSNWALIDRGEDYKPVWELVRDLGGDFKDAALVLEETWRKDESKRKKEREARNKEQETVKRMKHAIDELHSIKEKHLKMKHGAFTEKRWPTNSELDNTEVIKKREDAYHYGIEFIRMNPRYHFCTITQMLFGGFYRLKCWKASDNTPIAFRKNNRGHVLYYSKIMFKWNASRVHGRGQGVEIREQGP